ncbi:MAG TPA: ABC-2 family transporter protein [Pseudomonadales bacterium]|nr:ABC-2 family transporter protein [Pseudomonadales bacterium]
MRGYWSVVSARYRALLQYRAAAFAGFTTQVFWGLIMVMVMLAFYRLGSGRQPMSLAQVVSYIWLGQALLGMLPWNVDREIQDLIRQGSVSYELVRPLDLYNFWFSRTIAFRTATTTLRSVPMVIFAMFLLPTLGAPRWALMIPPNAQAVFGFLLSLFCALMLACAITMLMHVVMVKTISGDGLNRIMPSFVTVLSGMVVPLPLFPDWIQPFLNAQPFRGLVDVPFRIYTGNIVSTDILLNLLSQVGWALAFVALGRWLLNRSIRHLVVQGG